MNDANLNQTRRLAAIMFTDMVGFSRMTNQNPTLARQLNEEHQKIIRQFILKNNGFEKQTTGDGFFVEFLSAVEALNCAIEIQQTLHDRNLLAATDQKILIRIGLHAGEIFEKNNEIYGDVVNIAARLEALSEINGICFSESFYDLVKFNWSVKQFKYVENVELKNIKGRFNLYRFVFNWQITYKKNIFDYFLHSVRSLTKHSRWSIYSLYLSCLVLLAAIFIKAFSPQLFKVDQARRPSAIESFFQGQLLDKGWMYSVDNQSYIDFAVTQTWKYADLIKDKYKLKKEFNLENKPEEPAIILGLIADQHKVFLNGHYIGGANHLSDLALYTFDKSILKTVPETNMIVVEAYVQSSLNPGLNLVSDVPAQIGERSVLQKAQSQYYLKFYILKNIYFTFSLLIFIFSLIYSLVLKKREEYFYSSLVLLLGCLHLAYYNPWVSSTFDYTFLRYIRLSSVFLTSIVLISGYFSYTSQYKYLKFNNAFGFIAGGLLYYYFQIVKHEKSVTFVSAYNTFLFVGLIYSIIFSAVLLNNHFSNKNQDRAKAKKILNQGVVFLVFTLLNTLNFISAFKNGLTESVFSSSVRSLFADLGITLPFLYALAKTMITVTEFLSEKKINDLNNKSDDLAIQLSQVILQSDSELEKIKKIHQLSLQFLGAERSTLYITTEAYADKLILLNALGVTTQLSDKIDMFADNVFGYVIKNNQPLLVHDIYQDFRFKDKVNTVDNFFTSKSCLLIPLTYQNKKIGVMTFSDKEKTSQFTENDLKVAVKMSLFLSLLLINGLLDIKKVG